MSLYCIGTSSVFALDPCVQSSAEADLRSMWCREGYLSPSVFTNKYICAPVKINLRRFRSSRLTDQIVSGDSAGASAAQVRRPMLSEHFPPGTQGCYRRMLSVEDLRAFGDLVGDHDPIHFDAAFAAGTRYGRPVAHGALLVGFMSAASTQATQASRIPLVSLGYDRMRFIGPAFPGEEIEARFVVVSHDESRQRIFADVEVRSAGRLVAVARNILKGIA